MQVSVEKISPIARRLVISISADTVQQEVDKGFQEELRHRRIDGFRSGKVPRHVIEKKFGTQIRHKAIGKLIENSLPQALQQESLEPAGRPVIEEVKPNSGHEELTYIVNFEIFPELKMPELEKISVDEYAVEITDADLDKHIQDLQHQMATWSVVERAAKEGDKLTIDYTSTMDGKPYENSSNQKVSVELGTNLFIEGFEEGLVGASAGETRELNLHFPKDWRIEHLAGKPVEFSVVVKEVSEKQEAPLDEVFAKKIGAEDTTIESIRQKIKEGLEQQVKQASEEQLKQQVMDKLLEVSDIPLPKALVEQEMTLMHEDLHRRSHDKASEHCNHPDLKEKAEKRVSLSLIFREIVKLEGLTPDNDKVKEKISELARAYGNAEFVENMYYESEELLMGIRNSVLVDQAIDMILGRVTKVPKSITVQELFDRYKQQ